MKKYLVQIRDEDGTVSCSMNTPAEIIEMFGFEDCSGCEHEVFDVSEFGTVVRLIHSNFGQPNYHTFTSSATGEVMFEGYSTEH